MGDGLVLGEPWWDLRGAGAMESRQRAALGAELSRELGGRFWHPLRRARMRRVWPFLRGADFEVIAAFTASDDILIRLTADRWAIVHLTGSSHREVKNYPVTRMLTGGEAAQDAIDALSAQFGF